MHILALKSEYVWSLNNATPFLDVHTRVMMLGIVWALFHMQLAIDVGTLSVFTR